MRWNLSIERRSDGARLVRRLRRVAAALVRGGTVRRRRPSSLERLEERLALTAYMAVDDAAQVLRADPNGSQHEVDVLANDTPPADAMSTPRLEIVTPPTYGIAEVIFGFKETILYTPDPLYLGTDTLTYRVLSDTDEPSNEATVTFTIRNLVPTAFRDGVETQKNQAITVPILSNDIDDRPDDTLTVLVTSQPLHGTAEVVAVDGGFEVRYTPEADFIGLDYFKYKLRDEDGAESNLTNALITVVGDVPPSGPGAGEDVATTTEGAAVVIDALANDGAVEADIDPETLAIVTGPARGSVVLTRNDSGQPVFRYVPAAATGSVLVVDDPRDVDDGDFSAGHLSLREAVRLAEADGYAETFTYEVRDVRGVASNTATVTITVAAAPTTIVFSPVLTRRRSATLELVQVGDTSEGNAALRVATSITLIGPGGNHRLALAGQGHESDLRAFTVAAGGRLTLQNLTLVDFASDGDGGAVYVGPGGALNLVGADLRRNFAFGHGGGVFNLGTASIAGGRFVFNEAPDGGGVYTVGALDLASVTFVGNSAENGGGVYAAGNGRINVAGGLFDRNHAERLGGGLAIVNSRATLDHVDILRNDAEEGGGLFTVGDVKLSDVRIVGNRAVRGGGIANGTLVVPEQIGIHETIGGIDAARVVVRGNVATAEGGGVYNLGNLEFVDSRIEANQADRGGGVYAYRRGRAVLSFTDLAFTRVNIAGNSARLGGGIFNDLGNVTLRESTVARNTAEVRGGGIYNDSTVRAEQTTFTRNRAARSGGALHNGFGGATFVAGTVVGNRAPQGGGLYNDVGYLSIDGTVVARNRGLAGVRDVGGPTPPAATTTAAPSTAADLPAYTTLPADPTEYRLDTAGRLFRRQPGDAWSLLAEEVAKYFKRPNGDLYLLTRGGELKQLKLGYYWSNLQVGVRDLVMDDYGTLRMIDSVGSTTMYWSFDRYYVLPESPNWAPEALDPPSPLEVAVAAGLTVTQEIVAYDGSKQFLAPGQDFPLTRELVAILTDRGLPLLWDDHPANLPHRNGTARSPFTNIQMTIEPIMDKFDGPRRFGGELAQVHFVQYKCTLYCSTLGPDGNPIGEDERYVVFIDHDHLHRYTAGARQSAATAAASSIADTADTAGTSTRAASPRLQAAGEVATVATLLGGVPQPFAGPVQRREDQFVQALRTAPNGTIYQWGEAFDGRLRFGTEAGPAMLWRQPADGIWEPLDYVYGFAVGDDSSVTILDRRRVLRSQSAAGGAWNVVARDVRAYAQTADGAEYYLAADGALHRRASAGAAWTTLETGLRAFAVSPDGFVYALTTTGELRGGDGRTALRTLADGVKSFAMDADGGLYTLDDRGSLVRRTSPTRAVQLAGDVQDFRLALDGRVLALGQNGDLRQLTTRDHWTVLEQRVRQFVFATNGDLYLVTLDDVLRRQKLGSSWMTLAEGIASLTAFSDGDVYAYDAAGDFNIYASVGPYFALGPVLDSDQGGVDLLSTMPAARAPLRASSETYPVPEIEIVGDVKMIAELTLDVTEPMRPFPQIGLARLHRAQFKVTVYYNDAEANPRQRIVYLDHDHFHFALGADNDAQAVALDPPSPGEVMLAANLYSPLQYFPFGTEFPLSREAGAM